MSGVRLELTWPHKDEFLLVPKDEDGKPVWVDRDHPAAHEVRLTRETSAVGTFDSSDPHLDNTIFVGDSLDAMRVMCEVPEFAERYAGKVKLIYADPPFNTGQTLTHYDDWMEHATWLSFMWDRLMAMKDLLAPDGSIWVHLDDAEVHRMRCLMDEVFGADYFIGTIIWQKSDTVRNDARRFSTAHDYILVYGPPDWLVNRLPRPESMNAVYKNPDNDPRGPWLPGTLISPGFRASGDFEVITPGGATHRAPVGTSWRVPRSTFDDLLADNRIWFGAKGTAAPQRKLFLSEAKDRVVDTVWDVKEVGGNRQSKAEIKKLFPGEVPFSTPKPERLLERIIHIASNEGDLVFDPFAGSGTTAAVAQKMGRRWATSELSLENVDQFVAPRLAKVVEGEDLGGITEPVGWEGGGGFRTVVVEPSLYEVSADGMVFLRDDVSAEDLARAMAGQMRFTYTPEAAPFCGKRGRMLLAVVPGVVGVEEIDDLVAKLPENTRLTLAAGALLPGAADHLAKVSRGSRALKIPRDVLTRTLRAARDTEPGDLQ